MKHVREFSGNPGTSAASAKEKAQDLAACYARVFLGSEDGRRVLADLRAKFGLSRLVFPASGPIDINRGLLTEGERRVMSEIENALAAGAPTQLSTTQQQPTNDTTH